MLTNSKTKVFVIDDEQFIRESLAGYLEDCEFDVISAESAEEALERLKSDHCDVAIVDLRLPGMNGDALIQEIYKQLPKTRFLIHTGSVDYRLSKDLEAIGLCSDDVFFKPQHDLSLFVDKINQFLNSSQ